MVVNETIAFIEPLGNVVSQFVNTIQLFVGGVFGIYLLMAFIRWREYRVLTKLMRNIHNDLEALNKKLKVKSKKQRFGAYEKFLRKIEDKLGLK